MNPGMPIEQCRADAKHGVRLARLAYAERDPEQARALGIGISPEQQRAANDALQRLQKTK